MVFGPEDLIDLDGNGTCYVVQTSFLGGPVGKDGKRHNYWVYHLLEIDGSDIRVSRRDRRFPKWVWCTFKPNHKDTRQLTKEQKRQCWRRHVERERKRDGNCKDITYQLWDGIFYRMKGKTATQPAMAASRKDS
jgi:hypothetical protein